MKEALGVKPWKVAVNYLTIGIMFMNVAFANIVMVIACGCMLIGLAMLKDNMAQSHKRAMIVLVLSLLCVFVKSSILWENKLVAYALFAIFFIARQSLLIKIAKELEAKKGLTVIIISMNVMVSLLAYASKELSIIATIMLLHIIAMFFLARILLKKIIGNYEIRLSLLPISHPAMLAGIIGMMLLALTTGMWCASRYQMPYNSLKDPIPSITSTKTSSQTIATPDGGLLKMEIHVAHEGKNYQVLETFAWLQEPRVKTKETISFEAMGSLQDAVCNIDHMEAKVIYDNGEQTYACAVNEPYVFSLPRKGENIHGYIYYTFINMTDLEEPILSIGLTYRHHYTHLSYPFGDNGYEEYQLFYSQNE